jgi:hypothetical protein
MDAIRLFPLSEGLNVMEAGPDWGARGMGLILMGVVVVFLVATGVIALVFFVSRSSRPRSEIADLREEVDQLREEVEQLKKSSKANGSTDIKGR